MADQNALPPPPQYAYTDRVKGSLSNWDMGTGNTLPSDLVGYSIKQLMDEIKSVISDSTVQAKVDMLGNLLLAHIADDQNPHRDTIASVAPNAMYELFDTLFPGTTPVRAPVFSLSAGTFMDTTAYGSPLLTRSDSSAAAWYTASGSSYLNCWSMTSGNTNLVSIAKTDLATVATPDGRMGAPIGGSLNFAQGNASGGSGTDTDANNVITLDSSWDGSSAPWSITAGGNPDYQGDVFLYLYDIVGPNILNGATGIVYLSVGSYSADGTDYDVMILAITTGPNPVSPTRSAGTKLVRASKYADAVYASGWDVPVGVRFNITNPCTVTLSTVAPDTSDTSVAGLINSLMSYKTAGDHKALTDRIPALVTGVYTNVFVGTPEIYGVSAMAALKDSFASWNTTQDYSTPLFPAMQYAVADANVPYNVKQTEWTLVLAPYLPKYYSVTTEPTFELLTTNNVTIKAQRSASGTIWSLSIQDRTGVIINSTFTTAGDDGERIAITAGNNTIVVRVTGMTNAYRFSVPTREVDFGNLVFGSDTVNLGGDASTTVNPGGWSLVDYRFYDYSVPESTLFYLAEG